MIPAGRPHRLPGVLRPHRLSRAAAPWSSGSADAADRITEAREQASSRARRSASVDPAARSLQSDAADASSCVIALLVGRTRHHRRVSRNRSFAGCGQLDEAALDVVLAGRLATAAALAPRTSRGRWTRRRPRAMGRRPHPRRRRREVRRSPAPRAESRAEGPVSPPVAGPRACEADGGSGLGGRPGTRRRSDRQHGSSRARRCDVSRSPSSASCSAGRGCRPRGTRCSTLSGRTPIPTRRSTHCTRRRTSCGESSNRRTRTTCRRATSTRTRSLSGSILS